MLAIGLAATFMLSCEQDEEAIQPINEDAQTNEADFVDVTLDPATGEPVATNTDLYPSSERSGKSGSDFTNARLGGQIFEETTVNSGTEPNHSLEIFHTLPPGYVMTGIGLRIRDGIVTTMQVEDRYINIDGSLGPRFRTKHGIAPNHSLEAWFAAPEGFVITGIGVRVRNDNVTTLRAYFQRIDPNSKPENVILEERVFEANVGTVPNHSLEVDFDTRNLKSYKSPFFRNRAVYTGIGFRCDDDNITTMKSQIGYLVYDAAK